MCTIFRVLSPVVRVGFLGSPSAAQSGTAAGTIADAVCSAVEKALIGGCLLYEHNVVVRNNALVTGLRFRPAIIKDIMKDVLQ